MIINDSGFWEHRPATMTWPDYELRSILETTKNAEVEADAMLRTLHEIRALPETTERS